MTTRRGGALIFYGNALGIPFAFTALAISVVAFPLLIAGAALLLMGHAAVLPILGHSTWHLYRELVES